MANNLIKMINMPRRILIASLVEFLLIPVF